MIYMESPIGILCICGNDKAIYYCDIAEKSPKSEKTIPTAVEESAVRQLTEYFKGERKVFDLQFEFAYGTPFCRKIWSALLKLPYGKTVTYSELAELSGVPRAVRACATAVGKNPLLIFAPCHRVVAKNGIGGFSSGGVKNKKILLAIEKVKEL